MSEPMILLIGTTEGLRVVRAFVTGQLAVNGYWATDEHEDDEVFWAISHCESGYRVFAFYSKEAALECAQELELLDWSCIAIADSQLTQQVSEEWQKCCYGILLRHKKKHGSPHMLPKTFFREGDREC